MIKFSWKKINNKFGWNATSVLEYFFLKQNISIPKYLNRKIPKIVVDYAKQPYPKGPCYLLNINDVLEFTKNPNELYLYLELASKRSVFDYYMRGIIYLPLPLVEEYQIPWIELNPLLNVKNDKLYFKYEDNRRINSEY